MSGVAAVAAMAAVTIILLVRTVTTVAAREVVEAIMVVGAVELDLHQLLHPLLMLAVAEEELIARGGRQDHHQAVAQPPRQAPLKGMEAMGAIPAQVMA